eukprot:PITA_06204
MDFYGLRIEYELGGNSNYIAWKDRMEAVLEYNYLKEFIDQHIPKPLGLDAQNLVEWKKCVAKERHIILEEVQDHIVLSLHGKETMYAMWKELMDLFQNTSDHRKLALKDKLKKIKKDKGDTITKYLNKFTHYHDELGSVGITIFEDDMEEIWRNTKGSSSSKTDDKENCALASKVNKGKGKASQSESNSCHGGKKKYMSKVKCFYCHELGYFATNCSPKESKKKSSGGAMGAFLASQFKFYFTLITCVMSSMMGGVWYLDHGASFHITSDKDLFNYLEEKDLQMHIEMGDDRRYSATGLGTVTFQRDLGAPLTMIDVMYVPTLKKNLVSIFMLEYKGYDVVFSKGKALLCHSHGSGKEDRGSS